ncbi:hypothetical protein EJB05_23870 [Eragrostis curvula]|uniref:Small ribosomal subunit protein bS18c n=1 Tax=Eragrostis curvula TaxID=38414 RepID=A0A5J9V9I9_9POAL|nr:hypothetical protein EJB05_23870 [Eragrostis curvula]
MASSALRRSLPRCGSLRRALLSNPPPSASAAAGGTFLRSFKSGNDESMEEFEQRLFGKTGPNEGPLYNKLDRVGNAGRRYGMGSGMGAFGNRSSSETMGGFDSLNDGLSGMLGDAARNFQADDDEDEEDDEDFEFRPDVTFRRGSMYNTRDLDLTRPAAAKNPPRPQFETTTKEVLRKADFRNVRFLSNFLTEAGIIIKRSQCLDSKIKQHNSCYFRTMETILWRALDYRITRISAKAQRKIAREIKTARAFGLMPFTTMGRRPFIFGRSAEEHHSEEEYGYDFVEKEGEPDEGFYSLPIKNVTCEMFSVVEYAC